MDAILDQVAVSKRRDDADDFAAALMQTELSRTTQNSDNQIIARAQEAASRLIAGASWQDWVAVGRALQIGRAHAMYEAGTNEPKGSKYAACMSHWLAATKLDKVADKSARSRLLDLLDNIGAVEKWRQTVPANKRLELNHPNTVWRHWQKSLVPTSQQLRPPSPVAKLKESLIAAEEEVARLKQANGENSLTPKDTARHVVRVLRGMFSESKLVEICKLLGQAEKTKPHINKTPPRSFSSLFEGYRIDSEQQLADRITMIQQAATSRHLNDAEWRAVHRMRARLADLKRASGGSN
jgi:hypothetical protein